MRVVAVTALAILALTVSASAQNRNGPHRARPPATTPHTAPRAPDARARDRRSHDSLCAMLHAIIRTRPLTAEQRLQIQQYLEAQCRDVPRTPAPRWLFLISPH